MTNQQSETTAKRTAQHVRFAAKYVPLLARFANQQGWEFDDRFDGLQIEPHPDRGVWLTALSSWVMARIHDVEGHATEPLVISLPDPFVEACKAAHPCVFQDVNGCPVELPAPDWMQPGLVDVLIGSDPEFYCVLVGPKAQPPVDEGEELGLYSGGSVHEGGVRILKRQLITSWRAFDEATPIPTERLRLDARVFQWLAPFVRAADVTLGGPEGRIMITANAMPELTVFMMPIRPYDDDAEESGEAEQQIARASQ